MTDTVYSVTIPGGGVMTDTVYSVTIPGGVMTDTVYSVTIPGGGVMTDALYTNPISGKPLMGLVYYSEGYILFRSMAVRMSGFCTYLHIHRHRYCVH